MKTEKMSFKNIKDVLSRAEMKMIMAGSGKTCTSCYAQGIAYHCEYESGPRGAFCTCSVSGNDGTGCKTQ
jgi:hypothetical protein